MSSPQRPGAPSRPRIRRAHSDQQEFARQDDYPPEGPGSGPAPSAAPSTAPSAAHDRSTYYEYIAQHTGSTDPVTPPPPHGSAPAPFRWRGLVAGIVALAVIVGVLIVLGVVLLGPDRGIQSTDGQSPGPSPTGTQAAPDSPVEQTAGEQLSATADEGTAIAQEQLAEQWVVQLSAKKPGLEANGRTWAEEDILAEFTENQRRHPEAILLWSGDWSSFRLDDFWVTVLAEPYDEPEDALETCRNLGLDRDNCFAKKLSSSAGPDGTTRLND